MIGMSNQNEKPGFDQNVDDEFEFVNLEAAIERMPLLERASRASHWAGLYEVTPDAHPIFGGCELKGFTICAGFSGHGFMHGPVAGKLMAEYILDGKFSTRGCLHARPGPLRGRKIDKRVQCGLD